MLTEFDGSILTLLPETHRGLNEIALLDQEDLSNVQRLRFDPIRACNLRCGFCNANFDKVPVSYISVDDIAGVLKRDDLPKLSIVTLGCAYEPLLAKNLRDYLAAIIDTRPGLRLQIVTNGVLLQKHDLTDYLNEHIDLLHISVHSHIPDVYEAVTQRNDLRKLEEAIPKVRAACPNLHIHMVNVLSSINNHDLPGFVRWAFDLGASTVRLKRAFLAEEAQSGSPAKATLNSGTAIEIPLEEWNAIPSTLSGLTDITVKTGDSEKCGEHESQIYWLYRKQQPGTRIFLAIHDEIELSAVSKEFARVEHDGVFVHPANPLQKNTAALFKHVDLRDKRFFETFLYSPRREAEPVEFLVQFFESGSCKPLRTESRVVTGGNNIYWRIDIEKSLQQYCDVELSARMAAPMTSNAYAWASFRNPSFIV